MAAQNPDLPLAGYFTKLSAGYYRQTVNTTLDLCGDVISEYVQTSSAPVGPESVVHDVAAGPGVATAALIARLPKDQLPKDVLISDNNAMMVSGARGSVASASCPLPHVEVRELDAHDLSSIPDSHFTHSFNNYSIFTFVKPVDAVRETYRTLKDGGLAVITSWRRFPPLVLVLETQRLIRPDLPAMPVPGPDFFHEGHLEKVMQEAGFAADKIRSHRKDLVISGDEGVAGLKEFMTGPFMQRARTGYTDDDEKRWAETVGRVVKDEVERYGGIRFESYIALATK